MTNGNGDVPLNWVALEGLWTFHTAEIRYESPGSSPKSPYGLAICNRQLAGGLASVLINFEKILDNGRTAAGIALGYQSESSGYILCQPGAYGAAYSISE